MPIDPKSPLTLRALEDHLWAAADLFRNKVSNQKDYILALLFFKRASDSHREETAAALAELEGVAPEDAAAIIKANPRAYHSLGIPDRHFWEDVLDTDRAGLGQALNDALTAIGRANAKQLAGVFEHTDFNNKQALPADDLSEILDHFNALGRLTSERVSPDMLGDAYQWLIAKFAASAGKGGGEFIRRPRSALLAPASSGRSQAIPRMTRPADPAACCWRSSRRPSAFTARLAGA